MPGRPSKVRVYSGPRFAISGTQTLSCDECSPQRLLRLAGHIKQSWLESGSVYGYRKVTDDLRALGETCGKHRVYRLMNKEKLRSQTGYHRRRGKRGGSIADFAPNHLQQQFNLAEPNRVWVTDITYSTPSQRSPPIWE